MPEAPKRSGGLAQRRIFGQPASRVLLVGGAVVVGYVAWRRYQAGQSSSSNAGTPTPQGTPQDPGAPGTGVEIVTVEQQPPAGDPQGGSTQTAAQAGYRLLGDPAAAGSAFKRGVTVFIRDANGHFTPVTKSMQLPKGTPEYVKAGA
jgi:hypothetical protein